MTSSVETKRIPNNEQINRKYSATATAAAHSLATECAYLMWLRNQNIKLYVVKCVRNRKQRRWELRVLRHWSQRALAFTFYIGNRLRLHLIQKEKKNHYNLSQPINLIGFGFIMRIEYYIWRQYKNDATLFLCPYNIQLILALIFYCCIE